MTTDCCFLAILLISIYLGTFGFDNLSFVISQLALHGCNKFPPDEIYFFILAKTDRLVCSYIRLLLSYLIGITGFFVPK